MNEEVRWIVVMVGGLILCGMAETSHPVATLALAAILLCLGCRLDEKLRRH